MEVEVEVEVEEKVVGRGFIGVAAHLHSVQRQRTRTGFGQRSANQLRPAHSRLFKLQARAGKRGKGKETAEREPAVPGAGLLFDGAHHSPSSLLPPAASETSAACQRDQLFQRSQYLPRVTSVF